MTVKKYTNEELKAILDATHNAIVAIDEKGQITIFNHAAELIVGISAHESLGKPIEKIIPTTGLLTVLDAGTAEYSQKMKIGDVMVLSNRTPIFRD